MTNIYNINYDLNNLGQNYNALIEEIKKSSGYCKIMKSTWLVSTNENAAQLADRLLTRMDKNDVLFVSKVDADHSGWLREEAWNWINSNQSLAA